MLYSNTTHQRGRDKLYCKECDTENDINTSRCNKCNAYLKATNSPLTGGDRIKIIAFFIILVYPVGWIIILIAISALYIMQKDKNFKPIVNAQRYIKVYLIILALIPIISFSTHYYEKNAYSYDYNNPSVSYTLDSKGNMVKGDKISDLIYHKKYNEDVNSKTIMVVVASIVISMLVIKLLIFIFRNLFFKPLEEHQDWIIKNGIFSDAKTSKNDSINIVGRDNLSSYSVADEMLKWHNLLEKGLVTQEEFEKAKAKLMNDEKV